jgi:hypothetical protein
VTELRASDGVTLGTVTLLSGADTIAFDGANVWTVACGANTTTKIRVSDGAVVGTFPVGSCPGPIAFDGHSIWIASFANTGSRPTLSKLRPSDGTILETYFGGGFGPEGIEFDGASIWVTSPFGDSVSKF